MDKFVRKFKLVKIFEEIPKTELIDDWFISKLLSCNIQKYKYPDRHFLAIDKEQFFHYMDDKKMLWISKSIWDELKSKCINDNCLMNVVMNYTSTKK